MPMPISSGSTLNLPTLAPLASTLVPICTFLMSAFSSQPPPSGTSTPACSARPTLLRLRLTDAPSALLAASRCTAEMLV